MLDSVESFITIVQNKLSFRKGEPADAVYYIQRGRVKLSVLSKQGKEATIALFGQVIFWAKHALLLINPSAWQPLLRLRIALF
jgi:CRP-like cAMP-binding protein